MASNAANWVSEYMGFPVLAQSNPLLIRANLHFRHGDARGGRARGIRRSQQGLLVEADRAQWFSVDEARYEIAKGRIPIVDAVGQRFHDAC
jgi:hypothetical protein